jgi:Ca2+-binding EF-hand superfamily protein
MSRAGKSKISELDKKYFREIFMLHADKESDKIDYEALGKIFEMVDFKPNEKQEVEFKKMFVKNDCISFNGKNPFESPF